jgi:hypothetical protein
MIDPFWQVLLGVGVGAGVTFGATWWQLNRARDSEERAYARELAARRDEREAVALGELQEAIGRWYSETLQVVGSAYDVGKPTAVATVEAFIDESPIERNLTVHRLAQRCREDNLRLAVGEVVSLMIDEVQRVLHDDDIRTRADLYSAMASTAAAYHELQDRVGERLRSLE